MPSLSEEAAHHYRFTQVELARWRAARDALIGSRPSDHLRTIVDHAIAAARSEHRAAERRLFDVFDVITTNLLETGPQLLRPEQYRARLCERAKYHERIAAQVGGSEPEHAEMHRRLVAQLREAAAAVKIPAPRAPRRLR